jgi:hypothetical protein
MVRRAEMRAVPFWRRLAQKALATLRRRRDNLPENA